MNISMKIDYKNSDFIRRVFLQLDTETFSLSIDQLLSELHIVVERMSFSGAHKNLKYDDNSSLAEIDLLFEGEISPSMLNFIHWLAVNGNLGVLADKAGNVFLNACINRYQKATEIRFLTAVELPDLLKQSIIGRLYHIYPSTSRVVFEVSPSVIAGFVIKDKFKLVDKSLKTIASQIIKPRLNDLYNQSKKAVVNG